MTSVRELLNSYMHWYSGRSWITFAVGNKPALQSSYGDVMTSQVTATLTAGSIVYLGWQQRKHQSSTVPAFCERSPPLNGGFHSRRISDTESVPISWCHHCLYWGQQHILPEGSRFKIRIWQCDYCSGVALCHINLNGKQRWKPTVVMMPTLTSLAQVTAITTTSSATNADKVGIMTTLGFQRTRLKNSSSICYRYMTA